MKVLENLSLRIKVILCVLTMVLGINVLYFAVFKPKISDMMQTRAKLETLVGEIDRDVRAEAGLVVPTDEERQEWVKIEPVLQQRMPETLELPQVLEGIATLAKEMNIEDLTMASLPQEADQNNAGSGGTVRIGGRVISLGDNTGDSEDTDSRPGIEIKQATIEMAFHCEYKALAGFLEALQCLPRFVMISKLDIERELPQISVNMSVTVFSLGEMTKPAQSPETT